MCKDCGCTLADHTHHHGHDHHHHDHDHNHAHHPNPQLNDAKTVEVITKILDANDKEAAHNRAHFESHGVLAINLMSSPGSGKTALLEATIDTGAIRLGVIEGDLETNQDADRIKAKGAPAYQIATGQACHLDAFMVHKGLHAMPLDELDVVFVENVGNLVCPASYDVGTHLNVVLLSADVLIITKCNLLEHFDFSVEHAVTEARKLNPKIDVIQIDSKTGQGIEQWVNFLKLKMSMR
jgi:hydrogenase nickel incorporation protein HypB